MAAEEGNTRELKEVLEAHRLLRDYFALHPTIPHGGATEVERNACLKALSDRIEAMIKAIN